MIRRSFAAAVCAVSVLSMTLSARPGAQEAQWPPAGVLKLDKSIKAPEVVKEMKPAYTRAAMAARIEGTVEVEAVIDVNGRVSDVKVVRSLDKELGLDAEAVAAVKQWQFKPGMRDGKAVPVLVNIELSFALRK